MLSFTSQIPQKGSKTSMLYKDKGNTYISRYCDTNKANTLIDRGFTTENWVVIEWNIISWETKKQNGIVLSSVEAEYKAIVLLVWIKQFLQELKSSEITQMR